MEAVAMDKLIEKGGATPQLAQAIGEALDITLKAANLVTVPMLDARLAQLESKMEARFSSLERAFESTKVWAVLLYAGLAIAFFGALAADHRWLLNREDQFQARSDARFAAEEARTDHLFAEDHARTDKLIADENARTDKLIADEKARTDRLIADDDARTDKLIAEDRARTDKLIAERQAHAAKAEARTDAKFDRLRSLLLNRSHGP
jgi:hypothetical protein